MKSVVIIPAFNEEGSIKKVIDDVRSKCPGIDIAVINDGSSDRTAEICRACDCPVLDLPVNLGLSGAFQTGIRYAYENGYDAAVQIDGDGQHEPSYVPGMLEMIENESADVVIGSRFVSEKKPMTARMIGSRLLSFAVKATTKAVLTDPTSGMRAYNRKMLSVISENINFGPEPDTMAFLIREGAVIKEIQVKMYERETGVSYLTPLKSARYMINMFTSIFFVQFFRSGK